MIITKDILLTLLVVYFSNLFISLESYKIVYKLQTNKDYAVLVVIFSSEVKINTRLYRDIKRLALAFFVLE